MPDCRHQTLDFVGEQKTDEGVNAYYTCKSCGMLLVVTPSTQVLGVKGVQTDAHHAKQHTGKS